MNASLPSATAVLCCECKLLNDKQELFLKVDCKDSKSGKYGSEIKIDFAKKVDEGRTVARQETALGIIVNSAEEIAKKMNSNSASNFF
jgi:hypothetical protein